MSQYHLDRNIFESISRDYDAQMETLDEASRKRNLTRKFNDLRRALMNFEKEMNY